MVSPVSIPKINNRISYSLTGTGACPRVLLRALASGGSTIIVLPIVPIYSDYPESAQGNKVLIEKGARGIGRNRQSSRANIMALL